MAVHFFFQVSPTSSLPPFLSFLFLTAISVDSVVLQIVLWRN